jgi:hypothetical protein
LSLLRPNLLNLLVIEPPHHCLAFSLCHVEEFLKIGTLTPIPLIGLAVKDLYLEGHKVEGKRLDYNVGDALRSHFIHLRGVFRPDVLKTDNVLPTAWLILPVMQKFYGDLEDQLQGYIHKHIRLHPVL